MITNDQINRLIGVDEAYKAPDILLPILLDEERKTILFDSFLAVEPDLKRDQFRDYFQQEHGDRDKFKQDFTPDAFARLAVMPIEEASAIADICAGSGCLTINAWNRFPNAHFHCEELSDRALPFLLFNLAIRNIEAEVFHGDTLKRSYKAVYRLTKGVTYSTIEKLQDEPIPLKCEAVVMNPPYSVKWEPKVDERFANFGLAPKQFADYSFILHGLNLLKPDGFLVAVIPHGILFRGGKEGFIRQNIVKENYLSGVIGLPCNAFLNTRIPVCLYILQKRTERKPQDVLFIDAQKEFSKFGALNVMESKHINKVAIAWRERTNLERFASLVSAEEIEKNDFNLNISRYVDTIEVKETLSLAEIFRDLAQTEKEIQKTENELFGFFEEISGYSLADLKGIELWKESLKRTFTKSPTSKERLKANSIQRELF